MEIGRIRRVYLYSIYCLVFAVFPFVIKVHGQTTGNPATDNRSNIGSENRLDTNSEFANQPDENVVKDSGNRSWQTYDISGYTTSVKSVPNPEKNILDWILRETGTETWFGESTGVLSVGRHSVRCYHNAEVQNKVRAIVDRFAKTEQQDEVFGFQVLTIGNPNWRAKLMRLLTKVEAQTPGVEAWTAPKENAAQIFNELRRRSDFNHPISQTLITESGQPKKIIQQQPLNYFRSIVLDSKAFPPFRVETGQINEGYSIQFSSLRALDGRTMDAELFCSVRQVEQFRHVNIDVPSPTGNPQKHPISVPQTSSWRLRERFQWPADRVLIISAGVVAAPDRKVKPNRTLKEVFEPNRNQADVLIMVDCKGLFPRGKAPKSAYRLVPFKDVTR